MVKPNELKHWNQLTLDYMTEESDDPEDDSVIVEHRLQWRSESKLMLRLFRSIVIVHFVPC